MKLLLRSLRQLGVSKSPGVLFLVIAGILTAGAAVPLASRLASRTVAPITINEKAQLGERMAREFPSLEGNLAARSTSYENTTRALSGNEVTGLAVTKVHTNRPGVPPAGEAITGALKPEEEAALRSLSKREGKGDEIKAFFPSQYTGSFAVEGGGVSAVVRPLGALPVSAVTENGQVVYYGAYPETDSLHVVSSGRSEEFLYLRGQDAPRRFDYELSEIKGARKVMIEKGAIRFAGEAGCGLQIDAPWIVDASGKRREDAVKWELGQARADGSRRLSLVLVEGAKLSYPAVIDPSWSTTGGLATARSFHTATLLASGKVLVAGGYNGGYLNSAELYDPGTGTWSGTGALGTAREAHTATLLPNGKVLAVGGINSSGFLGSAELYDPAAGTWSATGSLATAHAFLTATLLPNGKVLVVGGFAAGGYFSGAELYDPATGTWSGTGPLATARVDHTATLLPNGKVLVAGGDNGGYLSSAGWFESDAGAWSGAGDLATARSFNEAT